MELLEEQFHLHSVMVVLFVVVTTKFFSMEKTIWVPEEKRPVVNWLGLLEEQSHQHLVVVLLLLLLQLLVIVKTNQKN